MLEFGKSNLWLARIRKPAKSTEKNGMPSVASTAKGGGNFSSSMGGHHHASLWMARIPAYSRIPAGVRWVARTLARTLSFCLRPFFEFT